MVTYSITAEQSLLKLKEGNKLYIDSIHNPADISKLLRLRTCKEGQHPYAIIVEEQME